VTTCKPSSSLAPTPDYQGGLPPDVEPCSCDEALALRAEVARLNEALDFGDNGLGLFKACQTDRDAWRAEVERLTETLKRARKMLDEGRPVGSPESRLASDLREVLG
jgi:hypothetical protein